MSSGRPSHELYDNVAAKVVVWVEDSLTEAYLSKLWQDPGVRLFVAGSAPTVEAAASDARKAGLKFVFGVRDRDFGKTNFSSWSDPVKELTVFRLPRHELENYLLDWQAISRCTENRRGKKAREIEAEVKRHAEALDWWFATKVTLFELSTTLARGFPEDPGQARINSFNDAVAYVLKRNQWHQWVCKLPQTLLAQSRIESLLTKHQKLVHVALSNGKWADVFPGKELLGKAKAFIKTRPRGTKKGEDMIDLAKAVADEQIPKPPKNEDRRPADLMLLHQELLRRVVL